MMARVWGYDWRFVATDRCGGAGVPEAQRGDGWASRAV